MNRINILIASALITQVIVGATFYRIGNVRGKREILDLYNENIKLNREYSDFQKERADVYENAYIDCRNTYSNLVNTVNALYQATK
mgnify:CR=1 FL=1